MSNNKELERAELHKTIWRIANDLRGSVDGWDFKTYVLGILFYRFISENLTSYLNEQERRAGSADFDYAKLTDTDAEFVIGYLKDRPEEKFSARQIAEWVFATFPDECQEKRANSRGDYIKADPQ